MKGSGFSEEELTPVFYQDDVNLLKSLLAEKECFEESAGKAFALLYFLRVITNAIPVKCLIWLLENGADPMAVDDDTGKSPYMICEPLLSALGYNKFNLEAEELIVLTTHLHKMELTLVEGSRDNLSKLTETFAFIMLYGGPMDEEEVMMARSDLLCSITKLDERGFFDAQIDAARVKWDKEQEKSLNGVKNHLKENVEKAREWREMNKAAEPREEKRVRRKI